MAYIERGRGKLVPVQVICDVFVSESERVPGLAFEVKAPLPNSDQTKVSKEKLFKLHFMEPLQIKQAYYALPYNPYGKKESYKWSFPMRWFDMRSDPCVLIGNELWDMLGGEGTYEAFVGIVRRLGKHYHERIYSEYLGLKPPDSYQELRF